MPIAGCRKQPLYGDILFSFFFSIGIFQIGGMGRYKWGYSQMYIRDRLSQLAWSALITIVNW